MRENKKIKITRIAKKKKKKARIPEGVNSNGDVLGKLFNGVVMNEEVIW